MTIGDVFLIAGVWLFIAFMAASLWEHRSWTFQETLARTIWWPFVLPILIIKGFIAAAKYAVGVARYVPDALGDIWRWES